VTCREHDTHTHTHTHCSCYCQMCKERSRIQRTLHSRLNHMQLNTQHLRRHSFLPGNYAVIRFRRFIGNAASLSCRNPMTRRHIPDTPFLNSQTQHSNYVVCNSGLMSSTQVLIVQQFNASTYGSAVQRNYL